MEYFCKLPQDIEEREIIVTDPMLATGGSATDAITLLKEKRAKYIRLVCSCGPRGYKSSNGCSSDVDIYAWLYR